MDIEARNLINDAYQRTEQCLTEHKDKLEALAQLLLQKETLNYTDVEALIGPPPFGEKHQVLPQVNSKCTVFTVQWTVNLCNINHNVSFVQDYEANLEKQSKLGDEGQGMGSHWKR